jgi:crotonobetainyl-CoA:carnitine CoA-transferase CaiB-like acyl-CoA transferase
MSGAFSGLRMIDATHVLAGPFATYQFALQGAEVIKVEAPDQPDQARMQGVDRSLNDDLMGTAFMAQATNKKAVAIDLKTEGGREVMRRLIGSADVFVQNFRPGAFEDLGLSYDDLHKDNPRLIYCHISAFGATGPRREQTGYDNVIQAFTGMMAMTGFGDGRPLKGGVPFVDYSTGYAAAFAIATALYQRERTGVGQFVDVSMFDVGVTLSSSHISNLTWGGADPKPKGNRFPFATIGCYRASDVEMMIGASNIAQQKRLWTVLGRPDMAKTNNNDRLDNHTEEEQELTRLIATRSAEEWESLFRTHRIPAARIRPLSEAVNDEQAKARGVVREAGVSDKNGRKLSVATSGVKLSMSPIEIHSPPPRVGGNTDEILSGLGYDVSALHDLRKIGAVS